MYLYRISLKQLLRHPRMALLLTALALIFIVLSFPLYYIYLAAPPPLPEVDHDAWWGPEDKKGMQDTSIRPFRIEFDDDMIRDLRHRLQNVRPLTPPLKGTGFQYGFNTAALQSWSQYWAQNYNFTERGREMNRYSHFKTNVQGLDIHFMRIKPEVPLNLEIVPMLILHGWPGSIREFYEAIPHLTAVSENRDFALEVIVPSIPGFGYSESAVRPGLGALEIAVVLRNLMRRLGHKKFYIQGGDWGGIICNNMATLFEKEILGFHTNLPLPITAKAPLVLGIFAYFKSLLVDSDLVDRVYPLSETFSFILEESGYFHLQATKPDTIGIAMADSPAGLLAYVLEKFSTGTNRDYRTLPDGGLERHFTKDQLLDNLMMYWAPNTFITCGRLYAESFNKRTLGMNLDDIPTQVPTWGLQSKHEILYIPPLILRLKYKNLIGNTVLQKGGHFLAFELPEDFSNDVLKAVERFRRFWKTKDEL